MPEAVIASSVEIDSANTEFDVLIIGTGFSGLAMGAQLKRRGRNDFVILERADDVGGTWRDNHYPGAACDQPSHMYSLSFRLNPEWTSIFSAQPEIWQYLRETAHDEGLVPHIRLNTDVQNASWDDVRKVWLVSTSTGTYTGRVLVSAAGLLSEPKLPDIEGIETFAGDVFHSARWDHSVPLDGRRVGVIGTGASGVQIIPQIAPIVQHLSVFQRTPNWVTPRGDYQYNELEKGMFRREPTRLQALRTSMFWENEERFAARAAIPSLLAKATEVALGHLEAQVPDPELRTRLTPQYAIGCKRILKSSDFYPALMRDNVDLITTGIERIDASAVVTVDGTRHELDGLVLATGFEATRPPIAKRIVGRGGRSLEQRWTSGAEAYKTVAVSGFPNLFILGGPNTGIGHNSQVYMFEAQIEHVLTVLQYMDDTETGTMEVSEGAEATFVASLDERAKSSVWMTGGCHSWYIDERSGRATTLWPDYSHSFQEEIPPLDPAAYIAV
ncbi:MAG: NAD(P)/FAD-dependent oxidoreductase [Hyphomicrobiales bacterium]|nr:MAG: NAD(P)/FAD-dependent oxidoreductase [Hyphomicrobiales bacterium]